MNFRATANGPGHPSPKGVVGIVQTDRNGRNDIPQVGLVLAVVAGQPSLVIPGEVVGERETIVADGDVGDDAAVVEAGTNVTPFFGVLVAACPATGGVHA